MSPIVLQVLIGMLVPLGILIIAKSRKLSDDGRWLLYFTAVILIQMGIEGFLTALGLLILPFVVLAVLIKLLPTRPLAGEAHSPA